MATIHPQILEQGGKKRFAILPYDEYHRLLEELADYDDLRLFGVFVEELKNRGQLDNTLIVFSSDHGEMLGDHGMTGKSKPYQPSAGIPLIVRGPGVRKGAVCDAPATTLDLAATFLDYAGAAVPSDMDSRSMCPYLEGKTDKLRDRVLSGLGGWRLVFDGRYKLIRGYRNEPLLFDLDKDPEENNNIAAKNPDIAARLGATLDKESPPTAATAKTKGGKRKKGKKQQALEEGP